MVGAPVNINRHKETYRVRSPLGWWVHDNEFPHQSWILLGLFSQERETNTYLVYSLLFGTSMLCVAKPKLNWYKLKSLHFMEEEFQTRDSKWLDKDCTTSLPRGHVSSSKMSNGFCLPPIQQVFLEPVHAGPCSTIVQSTDWKPDTQVQISGLPLASWATMSNSLASVPSSGKWDTFTCFIHSIHLWELAAQQRAM